MSRDLLFEKKKILSTLHVFADRKFKQFNLKSLRNSIDGYKVR